MLDNQITAQRHKTHQLTSCTLRSGIMDRSNLCDLVYVHGHITTRSTTWRLMCAQWTKRGNDKHRTALSLHNCKHLVSCMGKNLPISSGGSDSKRGHAEKSARTHARTAERDASGKTTITSALVCEIVEWQETPFPTKQALSDGQHSENSQTAVTLAHTAMPLADLRNGHGNKSMLEETRNHGSFIKQSKSSP